MSAKPPAECSAIEVRYPDGYRIEIIEQA